MRCVLCFSDKTGDFFNKQDKRLGCCTYWHCDNCKLIFLNPEIRLTKSNEKKRYDLHENNPNDAGYIKHLKKLTKPLMKSLNFPCEGLDFGCGPGPAMQKIFGNKDCVVRNYDPFYFPEKKLLNKKYEFIICTEVVEHFYNPNQEFRLFNNIIKTKGLLGIMTSFYQSKENFKDWWYHKEDTHVCFYHEETFLWIAGLLNWKIKLLIENVVIFQKNDI